jgi:hypothetical protein
MSPEARLAEFGIELPVPPTLPSGLAVDVEALVALAG